MSNRFKNHMILNPGVQMRGWGINRNHLESRRLQGRMLNAGDDLDHRVRLCD